MFAAFTRLGCGFHDLLHPCDGMHVCTDQTSVYTLIQKFRGNGVRTHVTSKGKNPLYRRLRGGSTSRRAASPTHFRLSYSGPLSPSVSLPPSRFACLYLFMSTSAHTFSKLFINIVRSNSNLKRKAHELRIDLEQQTTVRRVIVLP